MPLDTAMVGASTAPITHDVDARWIMAYAAGLRDTNPRYLDTHGQDELSRIRCFRSASSGR